MIDSLQYLTKELGIPLLVIGVLILAFVLLRTKGTKVDSVAAFEKLSRNGTPTVLEFYSNA